MTFISITFFTSRLSLNHLNNLVEASSIDLKVPFMLFARTYEVLSSAELAISKSLIIKNKSIKKILSNKIPRVEPCGSRKIISCQLL